MIIDRKCVMGRFENINTYIFYFYLCLNYRVTGYHGEEHFTLKILSC
jgi:hypothetical protein